MKFVRRLGAEAAWIVPFACIALVMLVLMRPYPHFSRPDHVRFVLDGRGTRVAIGVPYRGTVLTFPSGAAGYLDATRAPQTLLKAGSAFDRPFFAKSLMADIYPGVLHDGSLWNSASTYKGGLGFQRVELLLADDAGAYMGLGSVTTVLRGLGLPVIDMSSNVRGENAIMAHGIRVAAALVGQQREAEEQISRFEADYAALARELHPERLKAWPRVLWMGAESGLTHKIDLFALGESYRAAGIRNAAEGFPARAYDAERILAIDPDIIFGNRAEIMHDPRWRDLKAVKNNRVYAVGGGPRTLYLGWPMVARWMAEIGHPDQMSSQSRQLMRKTIQDEYHYTVSDDEIDTWLSVKTNLDAKYGKRFAR